MFLVGFRAARTEGEPTAIWHWDDSTPTVPRIRRISGGRRLREFYWCPDGSSFGRIGAGSYCLANPPKPRGFFCVWPFQQNPRAQTTFKVTHPQVDHNLLAAGLARRVQHHKFRPHNPNGAPPETPSRTPTPNAQTSQFLLPAHSPRNKTPKNHQSRQWHIHC